MVRVMLMLLKNALPCAPFSAFLRTSPPDYPTAYGCHSASAALPALSPLHCSTPYIMKKRGNPLWDTLLNCVLLLLV